MPNRHTSEGKLNRGLSVIDSYMLLREGTEVDDEDFYLACVLGWCVEWVSRQKKKFLATLPPNVGASLMFDEMFLNRSAAPGVCTCARRYYGQRLHEAGQPLLVQAANGAFTSSWCCSNRYRLTWIFVPSKMTSAFWVMQVGLSAINDGVLLKCHVQAIIKRYFKDKLYFLDLLELWNEVITERT